MFAPDHAVTVRSPYDIKRWGNPDKPYTLEWDYPVMYQGRLTDVRRRRMLATADQALGFTLKHKIPRHRLPAAMRKRLCEYAHTVSTIACTSSAR